MVYTCTVHNVICLFVLHKCQYTSVIYRLHFYSVALNVIKQWRHAPFLEWSSAESPGSTCSAILRIDSEMLDKFWPRSPLLTSFQIQEHFGSCFCVLYCLFLCYRLFFLSFLSTSSPLLNPSFEFPFLALLPTFSTLSLTPHPALSPLFSHFPLPPLSCLCSLTWQTWTGVSWVRKSVWSMVVCWWGTPVSMFPTWPSCPSSSSLAPTPWLFLSRSLSSAATSRQR